VYRGGSVLGFLPKRARQPLVGAWPQQTVFVTVLPTLVNRLVALAFVPGQDAVPWPRSGTRCGPGSAAEPRRRHGQAQDEEQGCQEAATQ
jgi:hypothetical protein